MGGWRLGLASLGLAVLFFIYFLQSSPGSRFSPLSRSPTRASSDPLSPQEISSQEQTRAIAGKQSPVSVIPNASLVTGRVMKFSIWDPALLSPKSSGTFYSLVLDVCASQKLGEAASLVKPGDRIEVFSRGPLSPDLFGQTIQGTVRVRGDEHGQRFWIRGIEVQGECP